MRLYGPNRFEIKHRDWFLPELTKRKYDELSESEKKSSHKKGRHYLRKFYLKSQKKELYVPKVDILETLDEKEKIVKYIMVLEFSVPKLLYGNSLQETSYLDYEKVIKKLHSSLFHIGVKVRFEHLATAQVTSVHFCKNVILPKDILLQDILAELEKVDVSKAFDVTKKEDNMKEIKNGSQILHLYSNTLESVFYDKVIDCYRPKNKRKDKGNIDYEREIIDEFNLYDTEVFRYEYRIKKTQTVKREINKALDRDKKSFAVFKDLFNKNLDRSILLNSWRHIIERPENQLVLIGKKEEHKILQKVFTVSKDKSSVHSINRALIYYGIISIARKYGVKKLRKIVAQHSAKSHPERLTNKIKEAEECTQGLSYSNGLAFIDKELEEYKLITRSVLSKL